MIRRASRIGEFLSGAAVAVFILALASTRGADGQTELGGEAKAGCRGGISTIGTSFFEARRVDLRDLDTARLVTPSVIDISPSGNHILVGDRDDYNVKLFDREGRLLSVIATRGEQPGQVFLLDGAAFRTDSTVVVTDAGRMQLMEFDLKGRLVAETHLPVRPITSVQMLDQSVLVGGRSPPTLADPRVKGVHVLDSAGNIFRSLGSQPLSSVGGVPRYLAATVPFFHVTRGGRDSIAVAWRLTNRVEVLDIDSGESRTFRIGGGLGYVDPDTLLHRLGPEEQSDVLNRSSPIVGLFTAAGYIIVAYFSPATGSENLRYLVYDRSGALVEFIDDPPLVLGVRADSLLAIGRPSSPNENRRYAVRIFSPCVTKPEDEGA